MENQEPKLTSLLARLEAARPLDPVRELYRVVSAQAVSAADGSPQHVKLLRNRFYLALQARAGLPVPAARAIDVDRCAVHGADLVIDLPWSVFQSADRRSGSYSRVLKGVAPAFRDYVDRGRPLLLPPGSEERALFVDGAGQRVSAATLHEWTPALPWRNLASASLPRTRWTPGNGYIRMCVCAEALLRTGDPVVAGLVVCVAPEQAWRNLLQWWADHGFGHAPETRTGSDLPPRPMLDRRPMVDPRTAAALPALRRQDWMQAVSDELPAVNSVVIRRLDFDRTVDGRRLTRWAAGLGPDDRLPASPRAPFVPSMERLAAEIGINRRSICRPEVMAFVYEIAAERGVVVVADGPSEPGHVTLGLLRDETGRMLERRLRAKGVGAAERRNAVGKVCSHLKTFMSDRGLGPAASAEPHVSEAFAAASAPRGDRDRRRSLRLACECLALLNKGAGLPTDFAAAVRLACRRKGYSLRRLGDELGLDQDERPDIPTDRVRDVVGRMEAALDLPADALVCRLPARRRTGLPLSAWPDHLRGKRHGALRTRVLRALSDDDRRLPSGRLRRRIRELAEIVDRPPARMQQRRVAQQRVPYRLTEFPEPLHAQWSRILAAKGTAEARAALALESPIGDDPDEILAGRDRWEPDTVRSYAYIVGYFFGWLTSAGAPPEACTLALFVFPRLFRRFVRWRHARLGPDLAGAPSRGDVDRASVVRSWFAPAAGILRDMPALRATLVPIAGLVEADQITALPADWNLVCDAAHREWTRVVETLKGDRENALEREDPRSRQARIHPLLRDRNPLRFVLRMIRGLEVERAALAPESVSWALAVRDAFYLAVQMVNAFRSDTLAQLDLACLDREKWRLVVPPAMFKNDESPVFDKGNYVRSIPDRHGFRALADLYLDVARPMLADGGQSALFLSRNGGPMLPASFSALAYRLFDRFLAEVPGTDLGIPGVRPGSNHAFRDLLAMATLWKTGGDLAKAAAMIHDSVSSVQCYLIILFEDDPTEADALVLSMI